MKLTWILCASVLASTGSASTDCYCLPGDECWPAESSWNALNTTVGGRLVATVPIGTPCHDPHYNATACAALRKSWHEPQTHYESSSSVMQTFFANQSCDPFTARSEPCELGNYVSYAVDVASSDDIVSAIKFAREHRLRFVIRNTGHDYFGRSTGAGALSVWTHHLSNITYTPWHDDDETYTGPAFTIGSGVMGYQILEAAHAHGLVVVTGECPTVGVAGGYTQGGGHSALSTSFGLGADQTLRMTVVTAEGEVVTASRKENRDLFWALSGGGGGNYGVVVDMTVKAYADATVGGAMLQVYASNTTAERFQDAVREFHERLPGMIDAGASVIYRLTAQYFMIAPLTAFNMSASDVRLILDPFVNSLNSLHIPHQVKYTQFNGYRDHFQTYMGPLPYGNLEVGTFQYGGRLIPRSVLQDGHSASALVSTLTDIAAHEVIIVGVGLNVSSSSDGDMPNGANPAWRRAAVTMQMGSLWNETAPWSDMLDDQRRMTEQFMPSVERVTPGGGAYENEADFRQKNWREVFFGDSYERLLQVKRRWDPEGFFYVLKGVGSDLWSVNEQGRMCRRDQGQGQSQGSCPV